METPQPGILPLPQFENMTNKKRTTVQQRNDRSTNKKRTRMVSPSTRQSPQDLRRGGVSRGEAGFAP